MNEHEVEKYDVRDSFDYKFQMRNKMISQMRLLMFVYGIAAFFIFIIFWVWPPVENILTDRHNILVAELEGYKKIPNLEGRISIIEKQLTALTTENIEARLARIEKAIAVGEVKLDDLKNLQVLRDDFRVMKSYMFSKPDQLVDFKTLQRDYEVLSKSISKTMGKEDILREIDSLRNLFYAILSIFGIIVTIFVGGWFIALRKQTKSYTEPQPQSEAPTEP